MCVRVNKYLHASPRTGFRIAEYKAANETFWNKMKEKMAKAIEAEISVEQDELQKKKEQKKKESRTSEEVTALQCQSLQEGPGHVVFVA